jgi:hypothetical protein
VAGGDGVGEVGVDDNAVEVTQHQQRRAGERVPVQQELVVGCVQIFVLALVFPAEKALFPYVRKAVAAAVLGDTLLEAEPFPGGVGLGGRRMTEEVAQVKEVLLRGRPFLEVNVLPLLDEFGYGHNADSLMA